MKKIVALISASTLAISTTIAPISTAPALADADAGVRAYISFKFGSGEPVKNRTQYGFQLNQTWDGGDEVIDPFAAPISGTVIDFAFNAEGLAKADVMGLDIIMVNEILNGQGRFNQNAGGNGNGGNGVFYLFSLFTGLGVACVAFDLWPCDSDGRKCKVLPDQMFSDVAFGMSPGRWRDLPDGFNVDTGPILANPCGVTQL